MSLPEGFIFSQGKFQDYVDCQRRFQLRYLVERIWPALEISQAGEFERLTLLGHIFHRMIHQHLLGIPREQISNLIHDEELNVWWDNYLGTGFEDSQLKFIWENDTQNFPEVTLTTPVDNFQVVAKYDLISLTKENRIIIMDWKTSKKHPGRIRLNDRMQTIIYPYLLVEAGSNILPLRKIKPIDVEMVYWFPTLPDQIQRFEYSQEVHSSNHQKILTIIQEVANKDSDDYLRTTDLNQCRFCNYRSLCERGVEAGEIDELLIRPEPQDDIPEYRLEIDQIAEIEF